MLRTIARLDGVSDRNAAEALGREFARLSLGDREPSWYWVPKTSNRSAELPARPVT